MVAHVFETDLDREQIGLGARVFDDRDAGALANTHDFAGDQGDAAAAMLMAPRLFNEF